MENKKGARALTSVMNIKICPNSKRSLSTIVVNLILILLVLVSIGVVWVVFNKTTEQKSDVAIEPFLVDIDIDPLSVIFYPATENISLKINRSPGEGNIDSLKFVIFDGNSSYEQIISTSLEELNEKTYSVNIGDLDGTSLESITVIPILMGKEGEKKIARFGKEYNFKTNKTKVVDVGGGSGGGGGGDSGGGNPHTCTAGAKRCFENLYYQTCNSAESAWELIDTCLANEKCDPTIGCVLKTCAEQSKNLCPNNNFCENLIINSSEGNNCCDTLCTSCQVGMGNCNLDSIDRCETNIIEDRNNCGVCGNVCNSTSICSNSVCILNTECTGKSDETSCDSGRGKCKNDLCYNLPTCSLNDCRNNNYIWNSIISGWNCGIVSDGIVCGSCPANSCNGNIFQNYSGINKICSSGVCGSCTPVEKTCSANEKCDNINGCLLKTCAEQSGDICSSDELCPGTQLTAVDSDKCCSTTCSLPSWNLCSQCGSGLFNFCDETECNSIAESCYFVNQIFPIPNSCTACSSTICSDYLNQVDCTTNKCGLSNCGWNSTINICQVILPPLIQICGNGLIEGTETCDDNNIVNSDGCSSLCSIESGWSCIGQPSVCNMIISCTDADSDGFNVSATGCGSLFDCDDNDNSIFPNAPEICGDGKDNQCSGDV